MIISYYSVTKPKPISNIVEKASFSRIPLGVHMRIDCEEGMRLGYEIFDAVNVLDLLVN